MTATEFARSWRAIPLADRLLVWCLERDTRLLAALSELVRTRADERIDVAVVYGARHVPGPAGTARLPAMQREWLTVLSA